MSLCQPREAFTLNSQTSKKPVFISEIEVHVKKNVMGLCRCSLVIPYHAYEKQRAFLLASLLFPRLSFKVQHSLGFMKYTLLA
jgi:hypothetical protein